MLDSDGVSWDVQVRDDGSLWVRLWTENGWGSVQLFQRAADFVGFVGRKVAELQGHRVVRVFSLGLGCDVAEAGTWAYCVVRFEMFASMEERALVHGVVRDYIAGVKIGSRERALSPAGVVEW